MNYTLISLGIILVAIIFLLYYLIQSKKNQIGTNIMTLGLSTTIPNVSFDKLANPTAPAYNISFWISVARLSSNSSLSGDTIFTINTSTKPVLSMSITSSATLRYASSDTVDVQTDHTIMTNFPLQKWVFVILSIAGNVVDMYIDGKLIKSEKFIGARKTPEKTSAFNFTQSNDCLMYLANFERNPDAIDPSTAWNKYMAGNGSNYFSSLLPNYGASFIVTKDDLEVKKVTF